MHTQIHYLTVSKFYIYIIPFTYFFHHTPDNVRVTLIEGKVAVSDTCGLQTVEMKPGQSAQLVSDGTFAVDEVDTETFLYWKEGFFYFDDVALVDMMKEIGKWYNIDIEFRNRFIFQKYFSNRIYFLLNSCFLLDNKAFTF